MEFCDVCNNMLYIGLSKQGESGGAAVEGGAVPAQLKYYCRDTSHVVSKPVLDQENKKAVVVLETQVAKKTFDFGYIVNEYTTLDPTLPRLRGMRCPNAECPIAGDAQAMLANEVVFLRYDDDALKYLYVCPHCREVWKTPA